MTATNQAPRRRIWLWVAIGVVAAVLAVSAGALTTILTDGGDEPEAVPQPTTSTTAPAAPEEPSPEQTPTPVATTLPASCEDVYPPDYIAALEADGYPLNDQTVALEVGTRDDQLGELIPTLPNLRCSWGAASESGLVTNVTQVTPDESANVLARMQELGYNCYDELGGTRCVTQEEIVTDGQSSFVGESHFLREDLWLATLWINFAPNNYTPTMVSSIWG